MVAESGLNETTIAQICAAASVSRRTFYAYFSSKEECFFAAYATIVKYLRMETDAAAAEQVGWPAKVAAKMQAGLEYLCEDMPSPPARKSPPEAVTASLAGGMTALVMRQVNSGEGESLPDLLPDLIELFLAPFLGRPEAVQVAQTAGG